MIDLTDRPAVLHVVGDHGLGPLAPVDASSCDMLDAVLHRLGPSSTVLWMRFAALAADSGMVDVDVAELAAWAGLTPQYAWHAMERLVKFSDCEFVATDVLVVPLHTRRRAARVLVSA